MNYQFMVILLFYTLEISDIARFSRLDMAKSLFLISNTINVFSHNLLKNREDLSRKIMLEKIIDVVEKNCQKKCFLYYIIRTIKFKKKSDARFNQNSKI